MNSDVDLKDLVVEDDSIFVDLDRSVDEADSNTNDKVYEIIRDKVRAYNNQLYTKRGSRWKIGW